MAQIIGIFYFSGTGNTKTIAELFSKKYQEKGCQVDLIPIEKNLADGRDGDIEKYTLVGVGYPVHAFNAPRIVYDWIKQLPSGNNKSTFIFKTSGDPYLQGGSTMMIRKKLQKKKYHVFSEKLLVMPSNVFIRYPDNLIKQLYQTAIKKVSKMSDDILAGKQNLQQNSFFSRFLTFSFSTMENFGARFFGRHLTISQACTQCGLCVHQCPTNNITKRNTRFVFGYNCTFCMRCIYGCPERAISSRFMSFLVLKKWYNLQEILNNQQLTEPYITPNTKGLFKHFYNYISQE